MKSLADVKLLVLTIVQFFSFHAMARAAGCPGVRTTMAQAGAAMSAADSENARSLYQQAVEQLELCTQSLTVADSNSLYVTYQALEAVAATSAAALWADDDRERARDLLMTAWHSIFVVCGSDPYVYKRLSFEGRTAFSIQALGMYQLMWREGYTSGLQINGCSAAGIAPQSSPTPDPNDTRR